MNHILIDCLRTLNWAIDSLMQRKEGRSKFKERGSLNMVPIFKSGTNSRLFEKTQIADICACRGLCSALSGRDLIFRNFTILS